jgi:hypothetical protein
VSEALAQMVVADPHRLRGLIDDDDWRGAWLKAFRTRLDRAERDAVRIYAELMGELGHKLEIAQLVVLHLGTDMDTAKRAIDAMKQATSDQRTLVSQCETFLSERYREEPALRAASPLRGLLVGESGAEVIGREGLDT